MKKAANTVEILIITALVVLVTVFGYTAFNNQKFQVAKLSDISLSSQKVNLANASPATLNKNIPYNNVETAGNNALSYLNMTPAAFDEGISTITYAALKANVSAEEDDMDVIALANALISALNINCAQLNSESISSSTLSTLVQILNAASDSVKSGSASNYVVSLQEQYITQLGSLLRS